MRHGNEESCKESPEEEDRQETGRQESAGPLHQPLRKVSTAAAIFFDAAGATPAEQP
jgi:hypothetical protein